MTAGNQPGPTPPAGPAPAAHTGQAGPGGAGGRAATVVSLRWSAWNSAVVVAACVLAGALLAWRHAQRPRDAADFLDGGVAAQRAAPERINPNVDSAASLRRLPGIGPARAKAIVAWREGRGGHAFRDACDLTAIRGIGPATTQRVSETGWLSFKDANGMASNGEGTKH